MTIEMIVKISRFLRLNSIIELKLNSLQMKSIQTVIKMKIFLILISFICVGIVFGQESVCDNNYGNYKILEAFRFENNMFFFTDGDFNFQLTEAKWNLTLNTKYKLTFKQFKRLDVSEWNDTKNLRLITSLAYPTKTEQKVIRMDKGKV